MENTGSGENRRSGMDWVGSALLLLAVVALVMLNLLKSGILGGTQALPLGVQTLFPLAFLFAGLSLLVFGALLLLPRVRRVLYRLSVGLAALSALSSVAYAIVWWVAAPELMFWQDYACIGLQTAACGLAAAAVFRRTRGALLLLLACASVTLSTLAFLLPPLVEPAVSALTRALALASPFALLVSSGLFVEDATETTQTTPAE